jgi:hypothetical protein
MAKLRSNAEGKTVEDGIVFAKSLSLDDVEAWIKEYIRATRRGERHASAQLQSQRCFSAVSG